MNNNNKKEKEYTAYEVAMEIKKSLYKSVLKAIKDVGNKSTAKKVVNDVLDPNDVPQVNSNNIPASKESVIIKSKNKGIKKLKKFISKRKYKKGEPIPGLSERGN